MGGKLYKCYSFTYYFHLYKNKILDSYEYIYIQNE